MQPTRLRGRASPTLMSHALFECGTFFCGQSLVKLRRSRWFAGATWRSQSIELGEHECNGDVTPTTFYAEVAGSLGLCIQFNHYAAANCAIVDDGRACQHQCGFFGAFIKCSHNQRSNRGLFQSRAHAVSERKCVLVHAHSCSRPHTRHFGSISDSTIFSSMQAAAKMAQPQTAATGFSSQARSRERRSSQGVHRMHCGISTLSEAPDVETGSERRA